CSARIGSQSLARTLECDDPNGLSRPPERPYLHYVVMPSPIGVFSSRCRQQRRLFISLATNHDGPSHPGDLIGKSNGGDLCRSAAHDPREPEPLGAVLSSIANDGHRTGDEEPSQVAIALPGDTAKSVLAAG